MERCPYEGCPFTAETEEEIDEHVEYVVSFDDHDHEPSRYVGRRSKR